MKKTQTLLIDGDWLAFWHTITNEYPCDWGNDLWTLHGHVDTAIQSTKAFLADLMDEKKEQARLFLKHHSSKDAHTKAQYAVQIKSLKKVNY